MADGWISVRSQLPTKSQQRVWCWITDGITVWPGMWMGPGWYNREIYDLPATYDGDFHYPHTMAVIAWQVALRPVALIETIEAKEKADEPVKV